MNEERNKWGCIPGYCPCGNALSVEEMDWNDGLCDECAIAMKLGEDPFDTNTDDVEPDDDAALVAAAADAPDGAAKP